MALAARERSLVEALRQDPLAVKALRQEADYDERGEPKGRAEVITKIVQEIVTGVQSNW